jgi:hypothetical protein
MMFLACILLIAAAAVHVFVLKASKCVVVHMLIICQCPSGWDRRIARPMAVRLPTALLLFPAAAFCCCQIYTINCLAAMQSVLALRPAAAGRATQLAEAINRCIWQGGLLDFRFDFGIRPAPFNPSSWLIWHAVAAQ